MKQNIIFCLFVFFLSVNLSSAQVLIGPVVGGQYSWTNFDDKDNKTFYKVKPVTGFHAGIGLSFLVRKRFFLHTSFLYSTKGKVIEGKEDKLLTNDVKYRYIDIPILYTVDFKANASKGKVFKYFVGAGPILSYWLGGKGEFYNTDLSENGVYEKRPYDIAFNVAPELTRDDQMTVENPNRIQLGVSITAGLVFEPMAFRKFMFNVRYDWGHSFLSRTSDGVFAGTYYVDELKSRNHGVRMSLSYMIDLRVEERKKGKSTIKKTNR